MTVHFIDFKFIESQYTLEPVSVALVDLQGRKEFYRCLIDCNHANASQWVKENVLFSLPKNMTALDRDDKPIWVTHEQLRKDVLEYFSDDPYPQIWADYSSHHYVLFCWIFGTMGDLPGKFEGIFRELRTKVFEYGIDVSLIPREGGLYHSLHDAKWNRELWKAIHVRERKRDYQLRE